MITDNEVLNTFKELNGKATKKAYKLSGRGSGSLVIRYRDKLVEFYYKYSENRKRNYKKIGSFHMNGSDGISVAKAFDIAKTLSTIRSDGGDMQSYLDAVGFSKNATQLEDLDTIATFGQLLTDYPELKLKGRSSYDNAKGMFKNHITELKRFKRIINKPANEIEPKDLVPIIARMIHERGLRQQCNRIRTYLVAAFNWAIAHDLNPRLYNHDGKPRRYGIQYNPAHNIPVQEDFENSKKSQLTDRQIWLIWHHAPEIMGKGGWLCRLALALGGRKTPSAYGNPMGQNRFRKQLPAHSALFTHSL